MSTSSSSSGGASGPTASASAPQDSQQQQRQAFLFFVPPPPTVWVQFADGVQVGFTPSPAAYLSSVLSGRSPFEGLNPANAGENAGANVGASAIARALHELFLRSQSEQHGPPPTSKPFLEKLPIKTWTAAMTATEKHCECAICLSDYEKDDKVMTLPCSHAFHKDCGMPWLVEHNVCPTCRFQLPTQQSEEQAAQTTQATQTTPTPASQSTQTEPEPELEPEAESDTSSRTAGVRRPRVPSTTFTERVVRQRVDDSQTTSQLPGAVSEEDLDNMLEEEADRLVQEEMRRQSRPATDVDFDDVDVEELLHDTQSGN